MNRMMFEDHLEAAERQLAEADHHVVHQREFVALLEYDGHDTTRATRLLREFEEVLAVHIADRDRVRKALGL